MPRRAIFVDRDGTLTEENGHVADASCLRLLPGSAAAIQRINRAGWQAVIVTNQPGVALGLPSEDTLADIHENLRLTLLEDGNRVDGIYHCPHPADGSCVCRKPGIALFERARDEMGIDLSTSFFVGDRVSDLQAAAACGMPSLLVRSGRGRETETKLSGLGLDPVGIVDTLEDAVKWVFERPVTTEASAS